MRKDKFSSRLGIILAAAAGSVGLGNVWKFPYMLGENGGAAFLLVYVLCVLLFGLPLMIAEFIIGKRATGSLHSAYRHLSGSRAWNGLPVLTFVSTMLVCGVYLVIIGWCVGYFYMAVTGTITQVVDMQSASTTFSDFSGQVWLVGGCTVISVVLSAAILWAGVSNGLERLSKILMPVLLVLLLILVVRVSWLDGAFSGYMFLFQPDWSCLTPKVVLDAMGQCFYSLSIGMGALITYGAYMPRDVRIARVSTQVVVLDTVAALLAGCAIFPAVFAFGFAPEQGPKLVFEMIPLVFNQMAGGRWFSMLFFALLVIAAITSAASLIEVLTASLVDLSSKGKHPLSRHRSLVICGGLCLGVALVCVVSGGVLDWTDRLTSTCTLPLIALGTVIYFGWFVNSTIITDELGGIRAGKWLIPLYRFLIRWFIPVVVLLIFLNGIGVV